MHSTGVETSLGIHFGELETFISKRAIEEDMLNFNNRVSIKNIEVNKEDRYIVVDIEVMESYLN